ncbi:MAG: phosphomannomutase/phosphoglucomutase [Desulfovibrionaceae bacterium]|nr:phosphomannomutase/phosphoglucomutase [Desulfovibrionaceae bacterium]
MDQLSPVFRAYDIRGKAGRDFDEAWAQRLGRACGLRFRAEGCRSAVLGQDCRLSSPALADALARGMLSAGVDVLRAGMIPTPCLYYAVQYLGRKAGVMVTASHNPAEDNGFKIWLGEGTLHDDGIRDIGRLMLAGDGEPDADTREGEEKTGQGALLSHVDIRPDYVSEIVARLGPCSPRRVVVDGGSGAAGPLCVETLRRMGAEVIPLFCEPDGRFVHHPPDPTRPENMRALARAVREERADLGVGLDGDGDRIGVVDRRGRLLNGDELLALYARDLLARHPGALILADVKCSQRLFEDIRARGGRAEMCRSGHSIAKARLREEGGLLAGELSGHIFHAENWYGFDDAIYCAARLLTVLDRLDEPLERLPGWPPVHATPETAMPCPDAIKFAVANRAVDWYRQRHPIVDMDGARVSFEGGWGLVRASNTSQALILRFEADSPERLAAMRADMEGRVRRWIAEAEEQRHGEEKPLKTAKND